MTETSKIPKFIGKYTENFSSKPFAYIALGVFVFVAFIAFFTPLVKLMDIITRLVLIGLLVDNILRMPKKK